MARLGEHKITYGSYQFTYTTINVQETNEYDGDNKWLIGTQFIFNISGYICEESPTDLANALTAFRTALSTPRQELKIEIDDESDVTPWHFNYDTKITATNDDAWGPYFDNINIETIYGNLAAKYSCSIRVFKKFCGSTGSVSPILHKSSNYDYDIDANGYTTRTYTGSITMSSAAKNADEYRNVLNIAIPQKFKRVSQKYAQSNGGRTLNVTIVDVEEYYALPRPITSGQVDWDVSSSLGAIIQCTLSGQMAVGPNGDKKDIVKKIIELVAAYFGPMIKGKFVFDNQQVSTNIYGSAINFNFSGKIPSKSGGSFKDFNKALNGMVSKPPSSDEAEVIGQYGSGQKGPMQPVSDCKAIAGTTNTQSTTQPTNPALESGTAQSVTGTTGGSAGSTIPTPGTQSGGSGLTAEHTQYPIWEYHERISYKCNLNKKIYHPKKAGSKPLVQQTGDPIYYIQQVGYCKQLGKEPDLPPPLLGQKAELMMFDFSDDMPLLIGGEKLYCKHWHYVMEVSSYDFDFTRDAKRNTDPRLSNDTSTTISVPNQLGNNNLR